MTIAVAAPTPVVCVEVSAGGCVPLGSGGTVATTAVAAPTPVLSVRAGVIAGAAVPQAAMTTIRLKVER